MKSIQIGIALAAAVYALATISSGLAASRRMPVHVAFVSPPLTVTSLVCRDNVCVETDAGTGVLTGDWSGTTVFTDRAIALPDGSFRFTTRETFTGIVAGCGTGSFSFIERGSIAPDFTFHDHWSIVGDSGTGDLAGITGRGTQDGAFAADLSNSGTFDGTIRC